MSYFRHPLLLLKYRIELTLFETSLRLHYVSCRRKSSNFTGKNCLNAVNLIWILIFSRLLERRINQLTSDLISTGYSGSWYVGGGWVGSGCRRTLDTISVTLPRGVWLIDLYLLIVSPLYFLHESIVTNCIIFGLAHFDFDWLIATVQWYFTYIWNDYLQQDVFFVQVT